MKEISLLITLFFVFHMIEARAEGIILKKIVKTPYYELIVDTPTNKYCKNPPFSEVTALRQDVSSGRARHTPSKPSKFFKSDILKISIEASGSVCDHKCRSAVTHAVLTAFGLWRSGCSRCSSENMKAISINGSFWVDNISLEKWQYAIDNGFFDPVEDPNKISRRSYRPRGAQPVVNFVNVKNNSTVEKICNARDAINIEPEIEATLCDTNQKMKLCKTDSCLNLPIKIGQSQSDCKMNANTVACATPDLSVGLNSDDFLFSYDFNNDQISHGVEFGTRRTGMKAVSLLYTIVHEVGHWFGLPHDEFINEAWPVNIMSNGLKREKDWCVSEWNLIQLDNSVDLEWGYRLHNNLGLKYISE